MTLQRIANGVIVAENDALVRGIVRSVLTSVEQQVFQAVDGLEAVHLARQFKARLVLLDIGMPRLNGLEACKVIRALPDYADVPIVMLTGYDDERVRQAAQYTGARDFITKPFRPDVLLARLAKYLRLPAGVAVDCGDDSLSSREQAWTAPNDPRSSLNDGVQIRAGLEIKRAQVWEVHKEAGPVPRDSPQLTEGREAIRIHRNAERSS